jgi:alkylhydroperoxidase family enzyme
MILSDVEWDACVLEPRHDRELEAYVRKEIGTVPTAVPYFTPSPWLVRAMTTMAYFGSPLVHVDYLLADLVGLVVSQDSSCRYCYGMQRTMMRVHGVPEARIRQIEHDFLEAGIDPQSKAALDFARRISRASPRVTAADANALVAAGWTRMAIAELAFQAAYNVFMNRLMTAGAIPVAPVERIAQHWALGWFAPLVRLLMRRRWHRVSAERLPAALREGPFAYLVVALDGLPAARALRGAIDEMWASPSLSRRAKALAIAVIARGLDSALAEREARRLLEETGLRAEEIEAILGHLGSPSLDPVEAAILPFAREMIRGRPIRIQQRTRALREHLSPVQIIEAMGVSALANAICRLDVVTQLG